MMHDERCSFDDRTRAAITELEAIVLRRYPEATFSVSRGEDDPQAIHLNVIADVEDLSDLIEVVLDRMMEIQIEDEIPIFLIPNRTAERNRAIIEAVRLRQGATPVPLDELPPQPAGKGNPA